MSEDPSAFDDILDQLAQGETYAARDDISGTHRTDLTDGGPDGSRGSRPAVGRRTPSLTVFTDQEPAITRGTGKVLILPRPAAMVRVFSLAVVVMMALMTALAAIIAQSVQDLTGEVRNDDRFNVAAEVRDQPIDPAVLTEPGSFKRLLERWPDRRQQLLIKRFRAFADLRDWQAAEQAYLDAAAEDGITIAAPDRLRYCEVLVAMRDIEGAQAALVQVPVEALDDEQRRRLDGLAARLQLAMMSAGS